MTIDAYLLELERLLPRTARLRAVAEVREHLRDAAAAERAAGASPLDAEVAVTQAFGPVDDVARRLGAELAGTAPRRLGRGRYGFDRSVYRPRRALVLVDAGDSQLGAGRSARGYVRRAVRRRSGLGTLEQP